MLDKFHSKLPKEDLKRLGRDCNKKFVSSDYKNNRVDDPTTITSKQAKTIQKYVKDFLDRAVVKYKEHEKQKAERAARSSGELAQSTTAVSSGATEAMTMDEEVVLSDIEDSPGSPGSDRKRKRDNDTESVEDETPSETPSIKRLKEEDVTGSPSPPPPPPPPTDTLLTEEEQSMREQEEALMRENEEAQRLEDEADQSNTGPVAEINGGGKKQNGVTKTLAVSPDTMDVDGEGGNGATLDRNEGHKQEVLSH